METNIIDKETEEAKKKAQYFGVNFVSLKQMSIPYDVLSVIPEDIARKSQVVVYKKDGKHLDIAIADPDKLKEKAPKILTDLKKRDGYSFSIAITTSTDFNYALLGYKQKNDQVNKQNNQVVTKDDSELPEIKLRGKKISRETLFKFPKKIAEKYRIIIFAEDERGKNVKVAVEDPDNLQTQEIINFIGSRNNINIKQYKSTKDDIDWALGLYDQKEEMPSQKPDVSANSQESAKLDQKTEAAKEEWKNTDDTERRELKRNEITKNVLDDKIDVTAGASLQNPNIGTSFGQPISLKNDREKAENNEEEVKSTDMKAEKSSEIQSVTNSTVLTASSDEEQNLDNMLPGGINNVKDLASIVTSGSIPRIVAAILYLATKIEASDVHIEADENNLYLRYRIDGVLKEMLKMPLSLQSPIVSRIKILAKMKIDEQRVPQDGRFDVDVMGKNIDLRVSTLPTIHGEKVVMRLLDKTTGIISLDKLGLIGENSKRVQNAIDKPYGIIFVTGPTGSGKTTTLYAILNKLNTPDVNIITLEDPVEYELPGINQCQIKPKIGFGFADGLRSILRQDPNIIMVGEVRDSETANMATHAALTGHLVLSTLHTNDSSGALPRLIDMGVEPYLITSSINAIIAQRLVRKLCDKCKVEVQIPERLKREIISELSQCHDEEIKKMATNDIKFYKPKGCSECKDGYKGRIGLFEVLSMTDRIEQLAVNRSTSSIIKRAALNQGLVTIRQDGFAKAAKGFTSIDEIIRATSK